MSLKLPSASTKLLLVAAALVSFTAPSQGAAWQAADDEYSEPGNCAFSKQLENQVEKIQFINQLRAAKEASESAYGESRANTVQAKMPNGEFMEIDTFSVDCLSCHDGITAKARDIRYKNDSINRTTDITSVKGSHPIGMDYGSYAYANKSFKPLRSLKMGMELIDGKVGCLTCHNPLNKKKYHLATSNEQSKLCYTCHTI